jgi:tetratricopeptide (TPR) repeat protein
MKMLFSRDSAAHGGLHLAMRRWRHRPATAALIGLLGAWAVGMPIASAGPITPTVPRPPASTQPGTGPAQAYARGVDALTQGRLDAAEQAFREAVKQDATDADALLGLVEVSFARRQLDEAERRLAAAAKAAPDHPRVLATQGRMLGVKGKTAEAEAALRKAIELDPKLVRPRIDLADLLAARRDHDAAIEQYREVTRLDARHAGAHYALGMSLQAKGQLDAAAESLKAAIERAPDSTLAPLALARLELGRRRAAPAMVEVERILKRDPKQVDALVIQGDVQELSGSADAALRSYAEAARHAPKSPIPGLRTAMLEHGRGRLDAAEAAYLKVLGIAPHPLAMNNLAALAVERKGDLTKAEGWARDAVRAEPRAPAFLDTLASVHRAQGRLADAAKVWTDAVAMSPRDPELKFRLGRALAESGQKDEARKVLQEALNLSTTFASVREARSLLASLS